MIDTSAIMPIWIPPDYLSKTRFIIFGIRMTWLIFRAVKFPNFDVPRMHNNANGDEENEREQRNYQGGNKRNPDKDESGMAIRGFPRQIFVANIKVEKENTI
jgi:hypothetical protein